MDSDGEELSVAAAPSSKSESDFFGHMIVYMLHSDFCLEFSTFRYVCT